MSIFLLFSTISFAIDNNQTKEMSQEDVDNWFKKYAKKEENIKELKAENKKLDKLNNTLDELNGMLGVDR